MDDEREAGVPGADGDAATVAAPPACGPLPPPPPPQASAGSVSATGAAASGASAAASAAAAAAAYLQQLLAEKRRLEERGASEGSPFLLTLKLLANELERLQNGGRPTPARQPVEEKRFADIIKEKPIKVTIRVLVPVKEHPKFNFVGKLLGPKGNSLKRLQEETMTKMAVLGRGSMRDKHKEEELRVSADPKYAHFNDDLHVEITAFAPPAEAHARIAYALAEVRKFMVPDYNDEIRQEQMREMQILNTAGVGVLSSADAVAAASAATSPVPPQSPKPGGGACVGGGGSGNGGGPGGGGRAGRSPAPAASAMSAMSAAAAAAAAGFLYAGPQAGAQGPQAPQQQLLLHPAFRGLQPAARPHVALPAATGMYRGSILSRLRSPHALGAPPGPPALAVAAAAAAAANGGRLGSPLGKATGARGSILSILAGGPRATAGDPAAAGLVVCGSSPEEEAAAAAAAAAAPAAAVYGLYDSYAAAAAAAVGGNGYGLLESFANGNGILTADTMEDIAASQEAGAANGHPGVTSDHLGGRGDLGSSGAVKLERARFRHDPYARYTAAPAGVKLPL